VSKDARTPRQKEVLWAQHRIGQASASRFYGRLIVEMKDGRIVTVTEERSYKPPQDT